MGRLLAIDYGLKRIGLAVSDPLRIIATPLDTVATAGIFPYLEQYLKREAVDLFVVGMPKTLANADSDIAPAVRRFVEQLKKHHPDKPVALMDERFTSSIARQAMIQGGMKKKDRRDKSQVDRLSATLILQDYMASLP